MGACLKRAFSKFSCLKYFRTFLATFPFFGREHILYRSTTMAIKLSTAQRQTTPCSYPAGVLSQQHSRAFVPEMCGTL